MEAFAILLLLVLVVFLGVLIGFAVFQYLAEREKRTMDEIRRIKQDTVDKMNQRNTVYTLQMLDYIKGKEKTNGSKEE